MPAIVNDEDGDGICDEVELGGCTDAEACNYDAEATDDDGSCDFTSCIVSTAQTPWRAATTLQPAKTTILATTARANVPPHHTLVVEESPQWFQA